MKKLLISLFSLTLLAGCAPDEETITTYPFKCDGYFGHLGKKAKIDFDGNELLLSLAGDLGWEVQNYTLDKVQKKYLFDNGKTYDINSKMNRSGDVLYISHETVDPNDGTFFLPEGKGYRVNLKDCKVYSNN
tara:strand:- start:130 stop:525 length:396 start_codon:yes stop_codon:yes gene_type:complete